MDPRRERAWNEWYGEHIDVLLSVPGFIAAQRFHSSCTPDQRPYLAMYEVAGAEVFTSESYLSIWGFDEWRALIDNWTRDIFQPVDGGTIDFATPPDSTQWAGFVSGEVPAVRRALSDVSSARASMHAAAVAGLDRSCEGVAWEVVAGPDEGAHSRSLQGVRTAEATYTPLIEFRRARG
jgi:hypothetical protein